MAHSASRPSGPGRTDPGSVLSARGLSIGYGGHAVLHGIELEIRAGELWFLVGPNGAGKSTFLRAVLGSIAPRAGTLVLAPSLVSRRRVGFVPQRCDLKPTLPMTVGEFVRLGLVGTHTGREGAPRASTGLSRRPDCRKARPGLLVASGGQRRRASRAASCGGPSS